MPRHTASHRHIRQVITSKITSYAMQKDNFIKHFDKNTSIVTFDTFLKILKGLEIGCLDAYCIPWIYDAHQGIFESAPASTHLPLLLLGLYCSA